MNITDRIRRSVRGRTDLVFRPVDFLAFGSEASVKRALKELTNIGVLVRLGMTYQGEFNDFEFVKRLVATIK
jgi:hypothetical protein